MNRRAFLTTTVVASAMTLLACQGTNTLGTVSSDVSIIASGLQGALPAIGTIANIPPQKLATVSAAIADLQKLASQLNTVTTATAAQPIIQQVEADVNTIIDALAGLPLPPTVSTALQAAAVLLPVIETAVGLIVPAKLAARSSAAQMSPDQARSVLRGMAK